MKTYSSYSSFETDEPEEKIVNDIENSRKELEKDLRNGELILSIIGGLISLPTANYFGFAYGAVILTFFIIFIALLVATRTIIIDQIAFRGDDSNQSIDIEFKRAWNKGPLLKTGAMGALVGIAGN